MSQKVPFKTVLSALTDSATNFPSRYLNYFTDLAPEDLKALMAIWPSVPLGRKRVLLKSLNEKYEADTLVSYKELAEALLGDPDGQVRSSALSLLAETENPRLISPLVEILKKDPEDTAKANAARALGQFVRLGELEQLSSESKKQVEDALLLVARDGPLPVRRAALDALGYSSQPEVKGLIEEAFSQHDPQSITSALRAMGKSANAKWQNEVLSMLNNDNPSVRLAAIEAAGELGLSKARTPLLQLIEEEGDDEILQAAIWSLSQIGGEDVRTYLETLLDQTDDKDIIEFLEDALANLSFTEDAEGFDLLAFDADEELNEDL